MSNEDNSQARAMTATVNHSTAMTATISHEQEETDEVDEDAYLAATNTFEHLPLWMVERYANATYELETTNKGPLLDAIIRTAQNILTTRIEAGDELKHETIKGIVGHVDGHGQCLIDSMNQLKGINKSAKIVQNKIIQDLIRAPEQSIGLNSARNVFKEEYGYDITITRDISDLTPKYVDGEYQSGPGELLWAADHDNSHYVLVSQVDGTSWCAVTGLFPSFHTGETTITVLKAGQVSQEQLRSQMVLFSHGGLMNPHIMGRQLTHFSPVFQSSGEVRKEDLLNQCLIMTSPDVDFVTEHSILKHSMDTTQLNIDQILSEQRKNKIAERPVKVKEFLVRKEQMIKLNVFSDWVQELKTAIGIKLKANEMGSIQKEKTTMKEHWTMWKAEKSIQQGYANVYNAIKKIEIKMIFQMNILRLVMCAKEISQARS
jgi:hypothetical protein